MFLWLLLQGACTVVISAITFPPPPPPPPPPVTLGSQDDATITDQVQIKFQRRSSDDDDEDAMIYRNRVLAVTGCSSSTRMFRHAGKHEAQLVAAGLDRWYVFDCAFASSTNIGTSAETTTTTRAEGDGAQVAVSKLQAAVMSQQQTSLSSSELPSEEFSDGSESESENFFNIDIVSFEHKTVEYGTAATTQRGLSAASLPNDPLLSHQSHYNLVNLPEAWEMMADADSWVNAKHIVCQVVDSGWDSEHSDLGDNAWTNSGETVCGNGQDDDDNGFVDDCHGYNHADDTGGEQLLGSTDHGTHVAGTIGANTDNGVGVAGAAGGRYSNHTMDGGGGRGRGLSIMTSVTFGTTGNRGFAEALVYGANHGAHISSNSWGYVQANVFEQAVLDAIDYAVDKGVIVVFAAGNDGSDEPRYPAYYQRTVAVAALSSNKAVASFSNFGPWVDIAAPGVNVYSTTGNNTYGFKSGTSMACPHVSAILGLGKSLYPSATSDDLVQCLFRTAENVDRLQSTLGPRQLGAGLVQAAGFLRCVEQLRDGMVFPTWAPTSTPVATPAGPTALMPVCPYTETYSSASQSRGLHFRAPVEFCIIGLHVPNEMNETLQNVQVFVRNSSPQSFPSTSKGSSAFYAAGLPSDTIIPTEIQVMEGQFVVLLGAAGTGTMRNSFCTKGWFKSNIGGHAVKLRRARATRNLYAEHADAYSGERGQMARINIYYRTGTCTDGSSLPSPAPTASPAPGPPGPPPVERLMPMCSYRRTFNSSSMSRGFYFVAPTDFCITGLNVPNEEGASTQNVQVLVRKDVPAVFPALSTGESIFYAANMSADTTIQTTIQVLKHEVVGILGTAGSTRMLNSYCSERLFASTIAGQPVTLGRLLAQASISASPASAYARSYESVGRINMHYTEGACESAPPTRIPSTKPSFVPSIEPSTEPSIEPSSLPSAESCVAAGYCGNCSEEGVGRGCDCPECRDAVCSMDKYCCDSLWDAGCADEARLLCDCGGERSSSPSLKPSGPSAHPSVPTLRPIRRPLPRPP